MLLAQEPQPGLQAVAPFLFYALAGLTCLSAWAIVLSQNIVRMAVYLLLTLCGVAGLYFMLSAELLAAVQLIVYAGGTLILIVFSIMLTSKNPFLQLKPKGWELALAIAIGGIIAGVLGLAVAKSPWTATATGSGIGSASETSGYISVTRVGEALLSTYLVPFEVAGVLLLVVMIGAAYMARRRT